MSVFVSGHFARGGSKGLCSWNCLSVLITEEKQKIPIKSGVNLSQEISNIESLNLAKVAV